MAINWLLTKQQCERYRVTRMTLKRRERAGTLPPAEYPFGNSIPARREDVLDEWDRKQAAKVAKQRASAEGKRELAKRREQSIAAATKGQEVLREKREAAAKAKKPKRKKQPATKKKPATPPARKPASKPASKRADSWRDRLPNSFEEGVQ
jgi:hypothetical protein